MQNISANFFFTILSALVIILTLISSGFFYYTLKNSEQAQKIPAYYFTLFFVLVALGLLSTFLRAFQLEALSIFSNNILYIIALFTQWHGFVARNNPHQRMLQNKWLYLNILFIAIVNYGIFYLYMDVFVIRAIILNINVASITFLALFFAFDDFRNVTKSADKLLKFMIIFMPFFSLTNIIWLLLFNADVYFFVLISTQTIQVFMWSMTLAIVLMLDVTDKHYLDSITDTLTGLYNRRFIESSVTESIAQAPNQRYAMLICDIDNFKSINDTYGHDVGDLVICEVSQCIQQCMGKDYMTGRYGGEEFIMFCRCEDINKTRQAVIQQAEKLRETVANTVVQVEGKSIQFTISLGVTCSTTPINHEISSSKQSFLKSSELYFKRADQALYQAKNTGKNKVCIL